jgi:hypothetical protein
MEPNYILWGTIFILVTFLGFWLAYLYGRKTKNFRWSEYLALMAMPIIFIILFSYFIEIKVLSLFVVSSFMGFVLEYIIGFAYHKTLNRRLWIYKRFSIGGYTSLLSIPVWGAAGVIFWFISKFVGL